MLFFLPSLNTSCSCAATPRLCLPLPTHSPHTTPQYLLVSVFGYAALGNDAPASILTGFDSAPIWVTILANLMVLTHMVPAYQGDCASHRDVADMPFWALHYMGNLVCTCSS